MRSPFRKSLFLSHYEISFNIINPQCTTGIIIHIKRIIDEEQGFDIDLCRLCEKIADYYGCCCEKVNVISCEVDEIRRPVYTCIVPRTIYGIQYMKMSFLYMKQTNFVYFNPADWPLTPKVNKIFIRINDHYFHGKCSKRVQRLTIGINEIQAESLGISEFGYVIVERLKEFPKIPINYIHLKIHENGDSEVPPDSQELAKHIKRKYNGELFKENQIFKVYFEDIDEKTHRYIAEVLKIGGERYYGIKGLNCTTVFELFGHVKVKKYFEFNPDIFEKCGIGGRVKKLEELCRRVLASRKYPKEVISALGIKHVKGILLYGPPGTGKTLIAKNLGKILNINNITVINGPELSDSHFGGTEKVLREVFARAIAEYAIRGKDSDLYLIIFDEIDSVCGTRRGGAAAWAADNTVNQMLTILDGVVELDNIIVVGITNRKDLVDSAVLRPGRLEVHLEIEMPNEEDRLKILQIHTQEMIKGGYVSGEVDLEALARVSAGYSGADLAGLVRSAVSYALSRGEPNININAEDFEKGLREMRK